MLKQATILLAVVIVFVGCFLLIERQASPFFQSCISQGGGDESNQSSKEGDSSIGSVILVYVRCSGRFLDGHGGGITALFTIVLAASTILLWIVTNKAAEAAKAAAEHIPTVEGAYVYVLLKKETVEEDLQMIGMGTGLIRQDFMIQVEVSLKNFGKTPAVIEQFTARLCYEGARPIFGTEARIQPKTIIGAGAEFEPPLVVSAQTLSKTDAEKIWAAKASLTLVGTLIYRDIWDRKWTVPFKGQNHFDAPIKYGNVGVGFRIDNDPPKKSA